jgi:AcrR family transcriptional regulator
MPKIVDHDARRAELLEAVRHVIARDGLDETTNRVIAVETGWSTGTLAHYFADKDELIEKTLEHVHERQAQRMRELEIADPRALLRELLLATLPLDTRRKEEAVVEVSFWARALHSSRLSLLQRKDFELWRTTVEDLLVKAALAQGMEMVSPDITAGLIVAFVDGLQLESALHPRRFTKATIIRLTDAMLDLVLPVK